MLVQVHRVHVAEELTPNPNPNPNPNTNPNPNPNPNPNQVHRVRAAEERDGCREPEQRRYVEEAEPAQQALLLG